MFKNYLMVAYRNLVRYKVYSTINIVGLAIGIAFCILTFLYVRHEWAFDRFHKKADRIYRVYNKGEISDPSAYVHGPLGPALAEAFPAQMEKVVRLHFNVRTLRYKDRSFREDIAFVDPSFWDVFSFSLLKGDPKTALASKDGIVITESVAQKFFGADDPMGQSLSFTRGSQVHHVVVTGVMQDIFEVSSIPFACLQSYENVEKALDSWSSWNNTSTYVLLHAQVQAKDLETLFPEYANRWYNKWEKMAIHLQPLSDVHLNPNIRGPESTSDRAYVYVLLSITTLVLFVACVNFMTLALGRSSSRTREVGIRKVVGAGKPQVMKQFLGESMLLSCVAFVVGVALAELFMPLFNSLMAQELSLVVHFDAFALMTLAGLALVVGVVAGSYPAFVLAGFMPIHMLKGRLKTVGGNLFSRMLVTFQIALSAILIIGALVITWQLDYLRTKPLGFDSEHLISVSRLSRLRNLGPNGIDTYKNALLSHHAILGVTGMHHMMRNGSWSQGTVGYGETTFKGVEQFFVDYDFVETLDIKLLEGRNYNEDLGTDPDASLIINETFAKQLGEDTALGKTLKRGDQNLTVVGVVNDFHFRSLHHKISPALLKCHPDYRFSRLLVRVRAKDIPGTLAFMKAQWEEVTQSSSFRFAFLDEDIDRQYRTEERWHRMVGYGTLFAIFIACLGAFGLTSIAVARRTKEIGIRKVLGAGVTNVVGLLSREFMILVGVANVIAWPVAWWAMNQWLADFAYRIELGIGAFVLGGALTLLVVIGTVSVQALKAARMNPVETLRYE